jgi:hypothetical protein
VCEQVSATLDQAITELDIPVDGAALAHCIGLLDRLTAKITTAVGDFDAAEAWRDTGATSMTAWLRHHTGRSSRQAASLTRTGRRLHHLPITRQAYRDGTLSTGQVQAIVVNLNDKTAPLFADTEATLIPTLAAMDVTDLSAVMQQWAQAAKDSLDEPEPHQPERSLHLSKTLGGRRELSASLDPEAGALAETALRLASTTDTEAEPERTPARRRADAFVDILRFFLDHQQHHRGGRHRPHLNVFLDEDDLPCQANRPAGHSGPLPDLAPFMAPNHRHHTHGSSHSRSGWLADGTTLDTVTLDRLACDCALHHILHHARSSILDYGMSARTAPPNLFAALIARDKHCRFPGCDRPPEWCQAHHVPSYEHGGPTSITTMVLECTRHHHLVHSPGWHNKLLPDGTYTITNPQGHTYTTHPPGRPPDLFHHPPPPP